MKIHINVDDEDSRFRLNLWVPTGLIKSRFIWKQAGKAKGMTPELADKLQKAFTTAYSEIKDYIKANGHFTLVEVQSDGNACEDNDMKTTIQRPRCKAKAERRGSNIHHFKKTPSRSHHCILPT